jgi:hypothetical protein
MPLRAMFAGLSSRRHVALAACCVACATAAPAAPPSPADGHASNWSFRVMLDGRAIGEHRFTVTPSSGGHTVQSDAAFTVRWLGVTLYRYQHRSVERWRGDCLDTLTADTDDDGQRTHVVAAMRGDILQVRGPAALEARGCVMSFAYWDPAMRSQQRLLNAQTGRLETVRITALAEDAAGVGVPPVGAKGWRIDGLKEAIVVWYAPQGEWLGLDTRVAGGRTLTYRLENR